MIGWYAELRINDSAKTIGRTRAHIWQNFKLALASESADKNIKDLQTAAKVPQDSVHKLQAKQLLPYYHCGGKHKAGDCRHKAAECHNCGKVGHLAHVCKGKSKPPMVKVPCSPQCSTMATCPINMLLEGPDDYSMYNLTGPPVKPLVASVKLNSINLKMELDTRASISVISEATFNGLWPKGKTPAIEESQVKLITYSGE